MLIVWHSIWYRCMWVGVCECTYESVGVYLRVCGWLEVKYYNHIHDPLSTCDASFCVLMSTLLFQILHWRMSHSKYDHKIQSVQNGKAVHGQLGWTVNTINVSCQAIYSLCKINWRQNSWYFWFGLLPDAAILKHATKHFAIPQQHHKIFNGSFLKCKCYKENGDKTKVYLPKFLLTKILHCNRCKWHCVGLTIGHLAFKA